MKKVIKITTQDNYFISILNPKNILIATLEKDVNTERWFILELLYPGEKLLIAYDKDKRIINYLYNHLFNTFDFDTSPSYQIRNFDYNLSIELYNKQEKEKNV